MGRRACLEIIGFWTPEYVRDKLTTLATFRAHRVLLAIQESHHVAFNGFAELLIVYKTALKIEAVLTLLRKLDDTPVSVEEIGGERE